MKTVFFGLAGMCFLFGGCQSTRQDRIDPSGGYLDAKTGNIPGLGELMVHRGETPDEPVGQAGENPIQPSGYSVFDEQGRRVMHVLGSETKLQAGRYLIRVDGPTHETGPFWVTIQAGKTTEVDVAKLVGSRAN